MRRERFIVAAGVTGLVVLTIALFLSSLTSIRTVGIDSFQRTADPRKIIVNVTIGIGDELAERSASEEARAVTVTVRVRQPVGSGPRILLGIQVPVVVTLKDPLGDRVVLVQDGSQVRDLGMYFAPTPSP